MFLIFCQNARILYGFMLLMFLLCIFHFFHVTPMPCNVSVTNHPCPASLYFVPEQVKSLEETAALFHVNSSWVRKTVDGYVIEVSCSCLPNHDEFTWHMDYIVQTGDSWELVSSKFGSFVMMKPDKQLVVSQIITLDLLCGCSESIQIVTYKIKPGDTLYTICSCFGADLNKTAKLNNIVNVGLIHAGEIIFIPATGLERLILHDNEDLRSRKMSRSRFHIILGSTLASVAVVLLSLAILIRILYNKRKGKEQPRASGRDTKYLHCSATSFTSHKKSEESVIPLFISDKTSVFPYYEVRHATSNFSMSQKIGQGSYGSVYLGRLRGTDVAIKQMKNTKSKEFLAELCILCKVHHNNLIGLIGYAAGGDSLFLVYEFAQNGALSDHLHNPSIKGYAPLSWTARVQIALDAARGLEYIHFLTKPYYVHRDVKTSNILLDSNFRAKIADFGLVKLIEHSPEIRTPSSRIVGTFGYLAPEYVRDGCVTTKSDVYAYGVVLMELLTGQTALTRTESPKNAEYIEHRSVVDLVLSAVEDNLDPLTQLIQCLDPNLTHYHKDSLFQMALLSKECVDDDWNRRPDMCQVVLRLSHILMNSIEWDKGLIT